MDKILESLMNFINENTTLLIIICVFLIFVNRFLQIFKVLKLLIFQLIILMDARDNKVKQFDKTFNRLKDLQHLLKKRIGIKRIM